MTSLLTADIDIEAKRVCAECVGEAYLKAEITRGGIGGVCDYCKGDGPTWILLELANRIEKAFEQHYERTARDMDGYEAAMHNDSDSRYSWERRGDETACAIADAARVDEELATDVHSILRNRHYDHGAAEMGEECPFSTDAHYERSTPDDAAFQTEWRMFEQHLKTEARYFGGAEILGRVFKGLDGHRTRQGRRVVVVAGPGRKIASLVRARVFQSDEKLEAAIMRPDLEVGPPPSGTAAPGRMNASGISVFYGATNEKTALSEVRPPVGSDVVVARFSLLRPVRLLDVEALREVFISGSIFDPGFRERLEHGKFLSSLSRRMSRVVLPEDERHGYLVTQVIADYLANVAKLDGIIYRSVQVGAKAANVVLFRHAAKVEPLSLPPGTKLLSSLYMTTEDGYEPWFWVHEEVPESSLESETKSPLDVLLEPIPHLDQLPKLLPTLKVETDSIRVHSVNGATYKTLSHSVHRHRTIKKSATTELGEF